MVILDLEDAVSSAHKQAARSALVEQPLDPQRVIVRVNAVGTDDFASDLEALGQTGYDLVMLAKTETVEQVGALSGRSVVALIETPLGVVNAIDIARAQGVVALMWGAEDLMAAMKGRSSRFPNGHYRGVAQHARATVLLAASAAGRVAIDAVYVDIPDVAGLRAEATDGAASGFDCKACVHPSQVELVRSAFRPDEAQIDWARRVVESAKNGGVVTLNGKMIDEPILSQARHILAAATSPRLDTDAL
jgi:citrate lyase subunit beta/citryl-CoA lyase